MSTVKHLLPEVHIPQAWYNIAADLPQPPPRCCIPVRASRLARMTWPRCLQWP